MFFINMTYLYLLYHSQHWIPCISSLVVGVEYMHIVHYINIHRYTGSTYISTPAVWQQKTRFTKSYQVQMLKTNTYQHPKFTQKSCYTSQAQQSHPAGQTPTFRAILDHTDRSKESPESGQFVTWEGGFILIPN